MVVRLFKTAWFARAARKARLSDAALAKAAGGVTRGQVEYLGGGVLKKRLDHNRLRSVLICRHEEDWIYVYLFAKQDRANIRDDELSAFRRLAEVYRRKSESDMMVELDAGILLEIRDGNESEIQK